MGQELLCEGVERGLASEFLNYAEGVREDSNVGWGHLRDVEAYVVEGTDDSVELSLQRRDVDKVEACCAAEIWVLRAVPSQTDDVVPDAGIRIDVNLSGQTGPLELF